MTRLLLRHFILLAALELGSFECQAIAEDARPDFECRFTELPIEIDGVGDDEAWKTAQLIDHFYLPWLGEESRPARTTTRSRLLWDREHLYFMAEMQDAD
ncbi:MAG: sugar-binding protein, partial [Pirellulaceae bacterium]